MNEITIRDVRTILTAPEGINLVVVKIETSEPGLHGLGCATFTQRHLAVKCAVDDYLRPFLVGKDPRRIEDIWQSAMVSGYWRNGPVLNNALSGVDMALWDIQGKLAGMPVYQLFGGKCREAAAVYRHADGREPQEVADHVAALMAQGYRHVRCQMGGYGGHGQALHTPEHALPGAYYDPAAYARSGENPSEKGRILIDTLASFHIDAKITDITVGPVLTRFELQPAPGIRVSRITSLANDIALALAAQHVRIEAPIPGKSAVGVEIPNKNIVTVVLRDIVESREFQTSASPVTLALGKSINGKIVVADLAKMPHMLIAGATGSGKSVCINDIIISLTYKSSPADLKMVLIDPKMVELGVFGSLPHMLIPVVTDPKKAAGALRWAVNEMMQRYKKFAEVGARDVGRYNDLQELPENRLPKIVVIIDELADLMLVAPDEVEDSICRIAQLGRASGLHLIVATQRPDANVITGLIKANIPSRCAFAVSSGIDSRIILDTMGAEKLLGRGDMLFQPNGAAKPSRLQCAFVSDEEVERIVDYFKKRKKKPVFDQEIVDSVTAIEKGGPSGGAFGEGKQEDELLGEAVRTVIENGQASISMIQRRLRVGYARAARLVDMMEQKGYVSGFDGSKARKVLIKFAEYEALFGGSDAPPPEADTAMPMPDLDGPIDI